MAMPIALERLGALLRAHLGQRLAQPRRAAGSARGRPVPPRGSGSSALAKRLTRRRAATTRPADRPPGSPAPRPPATAAPPPPRRAARPRPAMHVTSSQPSHSCARCRASVSAGVAPRHQLVPHVAQRVALAEATLRVVAGGGGDAAGAQFGERVGHGVGVVVAPCAPDRTPAARPARPASSAWAPRGRASRTSRPRARRLAARSGCWAARPPRARGPSGCPRAGRRWTG